MRAVAQPKAGPGGLTGAALETQRTSHGEPMPEALRTHFESAFGQDFSDVRIHAQSPEATAFGALAFARGNDIHFAPGQFDAHGSTGRFVLGHELTHITQQRAGRVATPNEDSPINADAGFEAEADLLGARAARSESPQLGTGPATPAASLSTPGPVADAVVRGESAQRLLDAGIGSTATSGPVQRRAARSVDALHAAVQRLEAPAAGAPGAATATGAGRTPTATGTGRTPAPMAAPIPARAPMAGAPVQRIPHPGPQAQGNPGLDASAQTAPAQPAGQPTPALAPAPAPMSESDAQAAQAHAILTQQYGSIHQFVRGRILILPQAAFQAQYERMTGPGRWATDVVARIGNLGGFADPATQTSYINQDSTAGFGMRTSAVIHEMLHNNAAPGWRAFVGREWDEGTTEWMTQGACRPAWLPAISAYPGQTSCITMAISQGLPEVDLQTAYLSGGVETKIAAWVDRHCTQSWAQIQASMQALNFPAALAGLARRTGPAPADETRRERNIERLEGHARE
jgi:hypothetical protein